MGCLAYFGYPEAHEDDAERAVLAALAAIDSLRDAAQPGGRALEVRIGVASGWGVLGDLAGTAQHEVVGQTPNLAARLLRLAQPGAIIISEQTARLLGNAFELTDLGVQRAATVAQGRQGPPTPSNRSAEVMSNNSFGRAVTRTPNSDIITLSGRLSGVGDHLGSYSG